MHEIAGPAAPTESPPPSTGREAALLLAAGLALLMGLQLLRVFLPLTAFYLHDAVGLSPAATGGISLLVFAVGLRAPQLARRHGWRTTLRWLAGLLALTRVIEQLSTSPAVDARVAVVGTALFALLLPLLLLGAGRSAGRRARLAVTTVIALGLETAARTLAGTFDLSWQADDRADAVVLATAAVCGLAALCAGRGRHPEPAARPWSWLALGVWLALYLLVFSNPAHLAARSGMPLAMAGWFVLGSWLTGLLIVGLLPIHAGSRWRGLEASLLAGGGAWAATFGGDGAWFGYLIGIPGMTVLLFDLLAAGPAKPSRSLAPGAAGMVSLILLYLIYGRFDQSFGPTQPVVYLIAVGLLVASAVTAARSSRPVAPPPPWGPWLVGLGIAGALALAAVRLLVPAEPAAPVRISGPVKIMTYNLHQGFDVHGRLAPERLARVIELERPDVLALQEVSRGWLVTGGLDLFDWMTRRLGLAGRFAGTADPQWGNAVLTRLPIRGSAYHPLPPDDLPLRRGVLDVTVETERGTLRVLCLHLHHRKQDDEIRTRQVEALLEIWGGTPGTLLLGDLNALPGSAAIERLRAAGLHDASVLLPPGGRGTTTRLDGRQIDWIFATGDLAFEGTVMRWSDASDHLPLMTTVHLTTRFRGAGPPIGAADTRRPRD